MSDDDFWRHLHDLGWSQAELARRLYLRNATVGSWQRVGVPGYARAYVALAADVALNARRVSDWAEPTDGRRRNR